MKFLEFLQLLRSQDGPNLLADMRSLHGQVGLDGRHFGGLGTNSRIIDGIRLDQCPQGAMLRLELFHQRFSLGTGLCKNSLYILLLLTGQSEVCRHFFKMAARRWCTVFPHEGERTKR